MTLIIGISALLAFALVIYFLPPKAWWIELLAVFLLTIGASFITTWVFKRKKWGLAVSIVIIGNLVLHRLGRLDWITLGGELVILGLITLIN